MRAPGWIWKAAAPCAAAAVAAAAVSWFAIGWDDSPSRVYPGGLVLRDREGGILRVTLGPGDVDCRPYYVASRDDWIVKALVASEDGEFFSHCGVRPMSALRALAQNIVRRRRVSGASTITMQTVRLVSPHRKSYFQKWAEAVRALKMERAKDKLWIISQYLNRAPFGSNFIGIEAAANGWFGKGAKDLGLGEAAMLAGMVQAPSRLRPDRHMDKALKRRDYVLDRMLATGAADAEQVEAARAVVPSLRRSPRPFLAPYYCDWFVSTLPGGASASGDVTTPLDPAIQGFCENAVSDAARDGAPSAAAVVLRVATGEIVALAASGDYFSSAGGQVNTAVSPRSAGSTLKPFLAAQALDLGLVSPSEMLPDVPSPRKGYAPSDFGGGFRGRASLADSLVLSLNVPFVHVLSRVGVDRFAGLLGGLGLVRAASSARESGLGLAVGNAEATLAGLAAAYGSLARSASGAGGPFSRESAYLVSEMLSGEERSRAASGHAAEAALPRFAWKTGTSSAHRDAWAVLWSPEYVVAVWRGRLSGGFGDTSLTGARSAAPVAWRIARLLHPSGSGPWFERPAGLARTAVCAVSGLPAGAACPGTVEGVAVAGRGDAAVCRIHSFGFDGLPRETPDPAVAAFAGQAALAAALAVARPADGAKFETAAGAGSVKIVCSAAGVPDGTRIWWFLDGKAVGTQEQGLPFSVDAEPGIHELVCATAEGISASSCFEVARP